MALTGCNDFLDRLAANGVIHKRTAPPVLGEKGRVKMGARRKVLANDRRGSILRAAQEVFSQKGLADSNISEIAKKAGVVDSIIYHYFKNKEDLLFSVLTHE